MQKTYSDIKNETYKLLKTEYPTIDLMFRNETADTLVIITHSVKEKKKIVDLLSNSGFFKTRRFKEPEWKFVLLNDKSIYNTFKNEKENAKPKI